MLKNIIKVVLSIAIFLFFTFAAFSQQRFKAGIVAGINAAQVDGDLAAGYNKIGLLGGLRVTTVLSNKFDVSLDFLYSQQGLCVGDFFLCFVENF